MSSNVIKSANRVRDCSEKPTARLRERGLVAESPARFAQPNKFSFYLLNYFIFAL